MVWEQGFNQCYHFMLQSYLAPLLKQNILQYSVLSLFSIISFLEYWFSLLRNWKRAHKSWIFFHDHRIFSCHHNLHLPFTKLYSSILYSCYKSCSSDLLRVQHMHSFFANTLSPNQYIWNTYNLGCLINE